VKVIDGKFGQSAPEADEEKPTLKEAINTALQHEEIGQQRDGQFFMVLNTEERLTFITNERSPAELMALTEAAKHVLLQQYLEDL
jgi:hypothetical protein